MYCETHRRNDAIVGDGRCGRRPGGARGGAAEAGAPARRHISLHFAALAACLCLIVGVTAPRVIGGFSAGSSVDRADGESAPGAVSESNMAPESGAEAEKDTAAALPSGAMRALGIMSAEDIVSVSTATLSDAETYKTYKVIGQEDMTAVREEEKRILPETGAELYALLT